MRPFRPWFAHCVISPPCFRHPKGVPSERNLLEPAVHQLIEYCGLRLGRVGALPGIVVGWGAAFGRSRRTPGCSSGRCAGGGGVGVTAGGGVVGRRRCWRRRWYSLPGPRTRSHRGGLRTACPGFPERRGSFAPSGPLPEIPSLRLSKDKSCHHAAANPTNRLVRPAGRSASNQEIRRKAPLTDLPRRRPSRLVHRLCAG